jgi:3-oxoacyl-(acyl-carrier-protein) synthase
MKFCTLSARWHWHGQVRRFRVLTAQNPRIAGITGKEPLAAGDSNAFRREKSASRRESVRMGYDNERIVVSGIGMVTSLGLDRETSWLNIQRGASNVRPIIGLPGLPDGEMLAAQVDLDDEHKGVLKILPMCLRAAGEAMDDADVAWPQFDAARFGCSINAHMGDTRWMHHFYLHGAEERFLGNPPWTEFWLPNSTCAHVARRYGLLGPRAAHSTACASSLISILSAVRMLQDDQCDIVLAGGGDAINSLFAAGFRQMRVLAESGMGSQCRPFARDRAGFVMGEGAAMLILERENHALRRGARIYAEVVGGHVLAEAHHVTGLDCSSEALTRLIQETLRKSRLDPGDIGYINAHATGTEQNDLVEMRAIRDVFADHCRDLCVSGSKSMLGHMINAAGAVEVAITLLAMRDGIAPPTINVSEPDPECCFDYVPLVAKPHRFNHALKLSVAFGGHLAAIALRRWNDAQTGYAYPTFRRAA